MINIIFYIKSFHRAQKVYNKVIGMSSFISLIRNNVSYIAFLTNVCLATFSSRLAYNISNVSYTLNPFL